MATREKQYDVSRKVPVTTDGNTFPAHPLQGGSEESEEGGRTRRGPHNNVRGDVEKALHEMERPFAVAPNGEILPGSEYDPAQAHILMLPRNEPKGAA